MFNPYYPNYPNYQNYTQNYQNCAQNLERGKNLTAVLEVINELLEAIKCININLYQATLQKLVNLD